MKKPDTKERRTRPGRVVVELGFDDGKKATIEAPDMMAAVDLGRTKSKELGHNFSSAIKWEVV